MLGLKVIFLFVSFFVALSLQDKIKVSVYYEVLCPDSVRFIVKQLNPVYEKLNKYIELDFVPYGKAIQNKIDGNWFFECQHGPKECYGNKVQACALNQGYTEKVRMAFVNCAMSDKHPDKAGEKCANSIPEMDWSKILDCASSSTGDDYLAYYGDRTHSLNPQLAFVPTVIFNDTYNETLMWDSLRNFQEVACKLLNNPPPCKN